MEQKKYIFTGEILNWKGHILHRIKRLSDGKIGEWIESELNLVNDIYYNVCWVDEEAKVYSNAYISGDAIIYGNAEVYGNSHIFDNARIFDNAKVYNSKIARRVKIYDNAKVFNSIYCDNEKIHNNTKINHNKDVI